MLKILIIGSEGFIGKAATEYFSSDQNFEVFGCDILNIRKSNYFFIDALERFSEIFRENKFSLCINASGSAKVPYSLENPLEDYKLNTYNVFYFLDCIRKYNPACKFLNLSSAAVYGNPQTSPVSELHQIAPISPYGWNKVQSELICKEFTEIYGTKTCSLRIFSVYGPGLKKQLFWDLFEKSNKGDSVALFGTGNESRDFIFIKDLLEVIKMVIFNCRFEGEVLNVANGEEVFIKKGVSLFFKFLNWEGTYNFTGLERVGDPVNWCADISKIEQMGYKRRYSFEEGIKLYVEWLKK